MSFDTKQIHHAIIDHGPAIRVVIAQASGSTPRGVGTSMLVWPDGQHGTIGGGELELRATNHARDMLKTPTHSTVQKVPLGPSLGQCCGGAVTIVLEYFDEYTPRPAQDDVVFARPIGRPAPMPVSVKQILDQANAKAHPPTLQLIDGWLIEPTFRPSASLWIYGAGHVGRAVVAVLSPLAQLSITWVDTSPERFPDHIADNVTTVHTPRPEMMVTLAPKDAHHLVLSYSHALDLELCHRLLGHGFSSAGLIGSATKWARFQTRLAALGHSPQRIATIQCPIGDPTLGKSPQAIAVGVACALLKAVALDMTTNRGLPIDGGHAPKQRAFDT